MGRQSVIPPLYGFCFALSSPVGWAVICQILQGILGKRGQKFEEFMKQDEQIQISFVPGYTRSRLQLTLLPSELKGGLGKHQNIWPVLKEALGGFSSLFFIKLHNYAWWVIKSLFHTSARVLKTMAALLTGLCWYLLLRILESVWNDFFQRVCLKWARGMPPSAWFAVWHLCPLPRSWLFSSVSVDFRNGRLISKWLKPRCSLYGNT